MNIPKIIFIAGSGHSGSTLLDMILGSAKECFSGGELKFLPKFYDNRGLSRDAKHRLCTCGKVVEKCSVWINVFKNIENNFFDRESSWKDLIKLGLKVIFCPKEIKFKKTNYEEVYEQLLKEAKKLKGKQVTTIIDSSKNLKELTYVNQLAKSKKIKLKVIHLIRDGRGVINSYEKVGYFWLKNYFRWLIQNLMLRRFIKRAINKKAVINLGYDLFAQNPEKYLNYLNKELNIIIEKDYPKKIREEKPHLIGGNRMRMKKFKGIKYDQSWKKRMPKWKQKILSVLCHIPNKQWVYKNKTQ